MTESLCHDVQFFYCFSVFGFHFKIFIGNIERN